MLLGRGDGTFTVEPQTFLVSAATYAGGAQLAAGDFTGDGKPELLSVTSSTNALWMFINTTQ